MKTIKSRITDKINANRSGLLLFTLLSLATVIFLAASQAVTQPFAGGAVPPGEVQMTGKLSQQKIVQGGQQTLYLDVGIKAPAEQRLLPREAATDMIIVLDRSGSMAGSKKMPYAKAAIRDVLAGLHPNDRFALVSFANDAVVHSPLVAVKLAQREQLSSLVDGIHTAGGTNMGEGLHRALNIITAKRSENQRKVLLLSDGQANQGITQPDRLAQIASQMTQYGVVVSSIGMGLDFNETLMTKIADHGMGHYAYLEDLSGLGNILAEDLRQTRQIYANSSSLHIKLGDGVRIVDAGGFPIQRIDAATVSIASGQLLSGSSKHFVITLQVPAGDVGDIMLGDMVLHYQVQGQRYQVAMNDEALHVAVVEAARRQEAVSSIDQEVYKQSWLKNNLGRMQSKLSHWLREGKKDKAEEEIAKYRNEVRVAETESSMPLVSDEMDARLKGMEQQLDDAFSGNRADQDIKRKRAAKSLQYGAIKEQRTTQ